ncbi:MAG: serine protease [Thermoguttaceae bacterium]|nr:serine protease [Thermoguttaceae bacterium]MDW8079811.1 serine protease [Thermoguttaceae bacterium]
MHTSSTQHPLPRAPVDNLLVAVKLLLSSRRIKPLIRELMSTFLAAWLVVGVILGSGRVCAFPLWWSGRWERNVVSVKPHPAVARIIAAEGAALSCGSGTLIAQTEQYGLVLTNWHVVREARGTIAVVFPDGMRVPAVVVAGDAVWDLALLMIPPVAIPPIPLADAVAQPGEYLVIAGYGRGNYRAAAGRCVQYVAPGIGYPAEMLEVSVGARQGDSGGPILNAQGQLAGVLFGTTGGRTIGSHAGRIRQFLLRAQNHLPGVYTQLVTLCRAIGYPMGQNGGPPSQFASSDGVSTVAPTAFVQEFGETVEEGEQIGRQAAITPPNYDPVAAVDSKVRSTLLPGAVSSFGRSSTGAATPWRASDSDRPPAVQVASNPWAGDRRYQFSSSSTGLSRSSSTAGSSQQNESWGTAGSTISESPWPGGLADRDKGYRSESGTLTHPEWETESYASSSQWSGPGSSLKAGTAGAGSSTKVGTLNGDSVSPSGGLTSSFSGGSWGSPGSSGTSGGSSAAAGGRSSAGSLSRTAGRASGGVTSQTTGYQSGATGEGFQGESKPDFGAAGSVYDYSSEYSHEYESQYSQEETRGTVSPEPSWGGKEESETSEPSSLRGGLSSQNKSRGEANRAGLSARERTTASTSWQNGDRSGKVVAGSRYQSPAAGHELESESGRYGWDGSGSSDWDDAGSGKNNSFSPEPSASGTFSSNKTRSVETDPGERGVGTTASSRRLSTGESSTNEEVSESSAGETSAEVTPAKQEPTSAVAGSGGSPPPLPSGVSNGSAGKGLVLPDEPPPDPFVLVGDLFYETVAILSISGFTLICLRLLLPRRRRRSTVYYRSRRYAPVYGPYWEP